MPIDQPPRRATPRLIALVAVLLLAVPGAARAQQPAAGAGARPAADSAAAQPAAQLESMMPMINQLIAKSLTATMQALAEPEVARQMARFTRNYYEALVAQGFTREEALRIVVSVGFPSVPSP